MILTLQPHHARPGIRVGGIFLCLLALRCLAQTAPPQGPAGAQSSTPMVITLEEAIRRAQANEPNFADCARRGEGDCARSLHCASGAVAQRGVSQSVSVYPGKRPGRDIAPDGTRTPAPPIFIANNAVHEYMSQAVVTETIGLKGIADMRLADATAARAAAEYEVARRGLVATVVGLYYMLSANEHKVAVAERAANEAADFADLTGKREAAREVAHADVVKAQLLQQQRERDLADARLAADRARLELGVLLFPDPRTSYATESTALPAMPSRADVEARAAAHNPDLRSALAAVHMSDAEVLGARAAYLPDLALNFNYGIDAAQFATKGPNGVNNLGYSASATVDIPVWDWLATPHRVKQTEIRRDAARVALTWTQRRLIAVLDEAYAEAAEAQRQAASLELSATTASESLRLTKLRYTAGEATALEVVDAQTALTAAENAREDGVVRYETGLANLQTLTGTL